MNEPRALVFAPGIDQDELVAAQKIIIVSIVYSQSILPGPDSRQKVRTRAGEHSPRSNNRYVGRSLRAVKGTYVFKVGC